MPDATDKFAEINCYLIPGVGATDAIFSRLTLPVGWVRHYINWVSNRKDESLVEYSKRLLPQIDKTKPSIIIGVSFGGAVAVELAKLCRPQLVVLVSSIPVSKSFPGYLRWPAALVPTAATGMITSLPGTLVKAGLGFAFAPVDAECRQILYEQVYTSDAGIMTWSVKALARWDNVEPPSNVFHIHGSADRLLPLRYVNPDKVIKDGGHFIVFSHGKEIGQAIAEKVAAICQRNTSKD